MLNEIVIHVKEGRPISAGLQRYPETITPVMLSLIRVGEEAGFLDEALAQVADYIDREIELPKPLQALDLLSKVSGLPPSFVIVGVTNYGPCFPWQKRSTIHADRVWYLDHHWLVRFLASGFSCGSDYPIPGSNTTGMQSALEVPVLGKTLRQLAMAKFGRAFGGALYKPGVPITKGMPLAADACGNEYLRAKMYPAFRWMQEGSGIHETFRATNAFTPIVLDMVGTGEKTGNMEQMVEKVADYYEGEAETIGKMPWLL